MVSIRADLKRFLTASAIVMSLALPVSAQETTSRLDELFERLSQTDLADWKSIEEEIWSEWSKSGSSAVDLLLRRGQSAMEEGNLGRAIEHFSALIDHAPEFAEGYNARATAYFLADLYGPSIEDIRMALSLNPRHFGAMTGLGQIMEQLDYTNEALDAYRAAAAIHPHRPDLKQAIERLERRVEGLEL